MLDSYVASQPFDYRGNERGHSERFNFSTMAFCSKKKILKQIVSNEQRLE